MLICCAIWTGIFEAVILWIILCVKWIHPVCYIHLVCYQRVALLCTEYCFHFGHILNLIVVYLILFTSGANITMQALQIFGYRHYVLVDAKQITGQIAGQSGQTCLTVS